MIKIKESELHFSFVRSSGPGGQHVNKVSTAVQLKYNIFESDISDEIRQRFISAYGKRISKNGFITIIAQSYNCLLYTSPSPRDREKSRMPSSA